MAERRALPYEWAEVKSRLQRAAPRLLPALGISDVPRGGMVMPLNPTRADRTRGSFVIRTEGDMAGVWKDFATGEAGDVLELIRYLKGLREPMDAYWWALDFLGLGKGNVRTQEQAALDRGRLERERIAAKARAEGVAEARALKLKAHWLALPKGWAGSVVETYLRSARAIPIERLAHVPGALRLEAGAEHFDKETGECTTWPAICSAVTRGKEITGLHRTFLAPDGSGKAPVAKAKMMYGSCKGGAIRLSPGASGLSPGEAARRGVAEPLILGEGIETTLTAAVAQPTYRAWAAGSLSLMRAFEWPACASAVILLKENDLSPEAVAEFARVEAWWRGQAAGRVVKVAASEVGSDFNDWAMA